MSVCVKYDYFMYLGLRGERLGGCGGLESGDLGLGIGGASTGELKNRPGNFWGVN